MRKIYQFTDSSLLYFDKGRFDNWCVYYKINAQKALALLDSEYFSVLLQLAAKYGKDQLYKDFLEFYPKVTEKIDNELIEQIVKIPQKYVQSDQLRMQKMWLSIYAGMVAEENKQFAKLKKRIKHLAVYQLLCLDKTIDFVVIFSRGKDWQTLSRICNEYGF